MAIPVDNFSIIGDVKINQSILTGYDYIADNIDALSQFKIDMKEHQQYLINVKEFGAKGDGITDDTQAIQAAVNYNPYPTSNFSRGKASINVYFPPGSYLISRPIELKNPGITLFGCPESPDYGTQIVARMCVLEGRQPQKNPDGSDKKDKDGNIIYTNQYTNFNYKHDIAFKGVGGIDATPKNPQPMFICHGVASPSFKNIGFRAFLSRYDKNKLIDNVEPTTAWFSPEPGVGANFVPNINGIDIDYKDGDAGIFNCKFMYLRTAVRMKGHDLWVKDSSFILGVTGIKLEIPVDGRLDLIHIYNNHFHSMALNGLWLNTSIYGRGREEDLWDANTGFTDELACIRLPDNLNYKDSNGVDKEIIDNNNTFYGRSEIIGNTQQLGPDFIKGNISGFKISENKCWHSSGMLVNCNCDQLKSLLDSGTAEVTNNTWSSYCEFKNITKYLYKFPMHGLLINNVGFADISDNTFIYGVKESILIQDCPFITVMRNKIIRPCCLYNKGSNTDNVLYKKQHFSAVKISGWHCQLGTICENTIIDDTPRQTRPEDDTTSPDSDFSKLISYFEFVDCPSNNCISENHIRGIDGYVPVTKFVKKNGKPSDANEEFDIIQTSCGASYSSNTSSLPCYKNEDCVERYYDSETTIGSNQNGTVTDGNLDITAKIDGLIVIKLSSGSAIVQGRKGFANANDYIEIGYVSSEYCPIFSIPVSKRDQIRLSGFFTLGDAIKNYPKDYAEIEIETSQNQQ